MQKSKIQERELNSLRRQLWKAEYLKNPNSKAFISAVWKDERGYNLQLHKLHIIWHNFINLMRAQGVKRIGILAPYKYGKTPNILGYLLHEISLNRNLRCKIVCNDDFNAKKRVQTIKQYIELDPDYRELFGEYIKPYKDGWWTKNAIQVVRDSLSTDATLEASGVLATGIGGTFDWVVFDDPCDLNNSVLSPARRESVHQAVNDVWLSRLDKGGQALYIGTAWHELDVGHSLLDRSGWAWLIMRVTEDLERLEYVYYVND